MAAGQILTQLATDHKYAEAIRYDWKNVKWTYHHIDYFSDALATGLIETGIAPGDVVLSWLPLHFSEQVRLSKTLVSIFLFLHRLCSHLSLYL